MFAASLLQLALDALQRLLVECQVAQLTCGIAALGTVHTGSGKLQGRQQRIELRERATGNHCDRNAASMQAFQGRERGRWNKDEFRSRLDLSQRSVDIEEEGVAPRLWRGLVVLIVHAE
ncbi:hypothetical protein PsSCT_45190 [Pseudomonas sp. SCT]